MFNRLKQKLKDYYLQAEEATNNQIPWYAVENGTMVVDVTELTKRKCFWKTVEEFRKFKEGSDHV